MRSYGRGDQNDTLGVLRESRTISGSGSTISDDVIKQLVILNLIQNLLNQSRSLQGDPGSSPG